MKKLTQENNDTFLSDFLREQTETKNFENLNFTDFEEFEEIEDNENFDEKNKALEPDPVDTAEKKINYDSNSLMILTIADKLQSIFLKTKFEKKLKSKNLTDEELKKKLDAYVEKLPLTDTEKTMLQEPLKALMEEKKVNVSPFYMLLGAIFATGLTRVLPFFIDID